MQLLLLIIFLALLVGPLRKPVLASWRGLVPILAGGIFGLIVSAMMVSFGAPAFLLILGPVFLGIALGAEGRKWLDKNFPKEKR